MKYITGVEYGDYNEPNFGRNPKRVCVLQFANWVLPSTGELVDIFMEAYAGLEPVLEHPGGIYQLVVNNSDYIEWHPDAPVVDQNDVVLVQTEREDWPSDRDIPEDYEPEPMDMSGPDDPKGENR
jgi:hypothetical protein